MMLGVMMSTLGCTFSIQAQSTPTPVDAVGTMVATTMQALTAAPGGGAVAPAGTAVSSENISLVIPTGLADNANAETITAVDSNSGAPWDIAPTHRRLTLTGYPLQGKFHEPQIFVYPAGDYAQKNSAAAEQMDRLQKILAGSALLPETLPAIPSFNATPQIAGQIKLISFQNGSGVRALTQYAQYAAPINNRELFYHFQGLTSDHTYYVIAILPITAPVLAEDESPDASVPEGGVAIPTVIGPNEVYYFSITEKLNSLAADQFTPSLTALDALIQSLVVTTP